MLITHGLTNVPGLTMAQAKEVTDMGAVIEVCFLQFQAGPNAPLPFLTHWTQINAKHVAQAVKEFGAKSMVISSDLGQSANMTHPDGIEVAIGAMKKRRHQRRRHRHDDAQEPGQAARARRLAKLARRETWARAAARRFAHPTLRQSALPAAGT